MTGIRTWILQQLEAERGRWARELHDETLQQLGALRLLLSGARRSGDRQRIDGAIDEAVELITTSIGDLRSLIADLRPAALDELGAKPALETLAARVRRQFDLEIELDIDLSGERLAAEIESTVYRVVQEALTNVAKHARASSVLVCVAHAREELEIVVRDDGRGIQSSADSGGFGLLGMRERLALVHGTLAIESTPGEGTTLRATIPAGRPAVRV